MKIRNTEQSNNWHYRTVERVSWKKCSQTYSQLAPGSYLGEDGFGAWYKPCVVCNGKLGDWPPSMDATSDASCTYRFSGIIHLHNWITLSQIRRMNSWSEFVSDHNYHLFFNFEAISDKIPNKERLSLYCSLKVMCIPLEAPFAQVK